MIGPQGLEIKEDEYLKNKLALRKHFNKFNRNILRNFVDKDDWTAHASVTANAFYYSSYNSIEIPYGILDDPYFNSDLPYVLNFGALGFVIGHEITHGFDNSGRTRDHLGNI